MWILLLIWTSLIHNLKSECDKKYSDITADHSMCKPINHDCDFQPKLHTSIKKSALLEKHNQLRNTIRFINEDFPRGTNILKMEWDDELYEIAAHYVRQCVEEPDCSECHQTGGSHVEQNFEVVTYDNDYEVKDHTQRFVDIIDRWGSEIKNLSGDIIQNFQLDESPKKNWVNIFRATTNKVGCDSINYKSTDNTFKEIYVCNYTPATLKEGEQIYKTGSKWCTECPGGMDCDTKYFRLCPPIETASGNTNSILTNNKILWECNFSNAMKEECKSKVQCYENWKTVCGFESCHQEIIIDKPKSSLLFLKPIFVNNHACLIFDYKKEHLPTAQGESTLIAVAVWNKGANYKFITIDDDSNVWTMASLNITVQNQEIQVGFVVCKARHTEGQKVSIRNLRVLNVSC